MKDNLPEVEDKDQTSLWVGPDCLLHRKIQGTDGKVEETYTTVSSTLISVEDIKVTKNLQNT